VTTGWVPCVVALGTNMGDREDLAFSTLADLRATEGFKVTGHSALHETVALGPHGLDPSMPGYLNQVILLDSAWSAPRTLEALLAIEAAHGRTRSGERYEQRTVDLDLITYGDLVCDTDVLTLPHPRAHERRFVLGPWNEVDRNAMLPGHGAVAELLAGLPADSA
jgi:2-amino-4-hydroxy-6-hydroxymethyldihydropteridine diphosphokinase